MARRAARDPQLILALGVALVLALEWQRGSETFNTSWSWPLAQALVSGAALVAAWPLRERLRLVPILTLGLAFQLGWIAVHLALDVAGDNETLSIYPSQGQVLLDGDYPRSEYPPGAVALFALEKLLGGETVRTSNAFVMVAFQLVCVGAIWALRTRWTPWLAAFVALWPLNAFYWEFRFELVPAAAVVAGIALASRERWSEAGLAFGIGTIVKWTPALAAAVVVLWLLRSRQVRATATHLLGFAIPVAIAYVPVLLWRPSEVLGAFTFHNDRTITAESMMYLPLRLLYDVGPGYWYFGAADVPAHLNRAVIWAQFAAVGLTLILALFARTRARALAIASLAPAVFLLTNRIFSAQFFVTVLAALLVAAALVARRRSEVLTVAAAGAVATTANTILFQSMLAGEPTVEHPGWTFVSATAFAPAAAGVLLLLALAFRSETVVRRSRIEEARRYLGRHAATAAALVGVLGAYVALRVPLLARFPPVTDEATYALWAERAGEQFASLEASKEPLLRWTALGFMSLGAPPLTAVRLVSFFAGLATLVAIALIAHRMGGRPGALAASVVAVLLPLFVIYDILGIHEALAAAVAAWALYLQLRLAAEPRLGLALLLGVVFAAGLLTKQTTYIALALLPASLLCFDRGVPHAARRFVVWAGAAALALGVAWVAHSMLKPSEFDDHLGATRDSAYRMHSLKTGLQDPLRWVKANAESYADALVGYLSFPIVVAAVVGAVIALKRRSRLGAVVVVWAAAPLAVAVLLAEHATPRYIVSAGPALSVLAGTGLVAIVRALQARGIGARAAVGATALLFVPAVVWDARVVASPTTAAYPGLDDADLAIGWPAGGPWPNLEQELAARAAAFSTFGVVVDDQSVSTAELVLRDERVAVFQSHAPEAATARFAVANAAPVDEPTGPRTWIEIWRGERPRGGAPLVLYKSAVELDGTRYSTPDELRAGLGLSDPGFDAFLAANPSLFGWYAAYHRDVGQ